MPFHRRLIPFFLVFTASVALDQVTKALAIRDFKGKPPIEYLGNIFRFQYAENDGAFLSLGASLPDGLRFFILTVAVGGLLFGLLIYTFVHRSVNTAHVIAYALVISGGGSNWFDRARFGGRVVDFMNMGIGSLRTGVFNVADLAILAGLGVLLLNSRNDEKAKSDSDKAKADQSAVEAQPPSP